MAAIESSQAFIPAIVLSSGDALLGEEDAVFEKRKDGLRRPVIHSITQQDTEEKKIITLIVMSIDYSKSYHVEAQFTTGDTNVVGVKRNVVIKNALHIYFVWKEYFLMINNEEESSVKDG